MALVRDAVEPEWTRPESRSQAGLPCRESLNIHTLLGPRPPLIRLLFDFFIPCEVGSLLSTSQLYAGFGGMIDWSRIAEVKYNGIMAAALDRDQCTCTFPSIRFHSSFRRTAWQLLLATTATNVEICIKPLTGRTVTAKIASPPAADGNTAPVLLSTPVSWIYDFVNEVSGHPISDIHVYGVRYLSHFQAPLAAYLWPQLKSIDHSVHHAVVCAPFHVLLQMSTRNCSTKDHIIGRGGAIGMDSFVSPFWIVAGESCWNSFVYT